MQRRRFLKGMLGGIALIAFAPLAISRRAWAGSDYEKMSKTQNEWRALLTPEQYHVLREEGTERPYTSALLEEHRDGIFSCVACALPLFHSRSKFDSGTGWPSFYEAISGHIGTSTDTKLLYPRTEYHCARCDGHHGHVFEDGPKPTGLRYCNNGVALQFIPSKG